MEEDFSSGSNSEPVSSDERVSQTQTENKSGRKKKDRSSSLRRKAESNLPLSSPVESKYLRSDDLTPKHSLARGGEKCIFVPKDKVITSIKEIVRNTENNHGSEACNGFNRIQFARIEENVGHIQVHVISNSVSKPVSDQNLMRLVTYRNLVAHELPRMDRSYITRLVFDPKHQNLVLLKEGNVIGGICFRMFPVRDFSEIVFLCIASKEHVKGYGTHMLNHLKDYHIKHKVHNLLTCAAEEAFDYFEKQGFTSTITLDKSVYTGYIKFYHPATLMECKLDKRITYTKFSDVVSRNKMILKKLIKEYQGSSKEVSEEKKTETNKESKKL